MRPVGGILPVHWRVGIDGHAPRAKLDHRRVLPYVHRAGRDESFDIVGQLALAGEAGAIMCRRVRRAAPYGVDRVVEDCPEPGRHGGR